MERMEKVLAGLKCCQQCRLDDDEHFYVQECENCPYREQWTEAHEHCADTLMRDAAALIREQQERIKALEEEKTPRVMTLEDVKSKKVCWIEFVERVFPAIYYCQGNNKRFSVFIVNGESDISDDYEDDLTDNEIWLENNYINQLWRPWSAQPTDEQREAVKWE